MKKTFSKIVAVALLLGVMLGAAACNAKKDSQYVGEWKATSANASGIEVNLATIGLEMSMSIKADGKISVSSAGESGEGTWEETGDGIKIKSNNDEMDCKFVNGKLEMFEPKSKVTIFFEKQQ